MSDKYFTINIRAYLDKDEPTYIGEDSLYDLLSDFSCPKEKQIAGSVLLGFALETISNLKYSVGGVMEFLECEDNQFLLNFYTRNHFRPFDFLLPELIILHINFTSHPRLVDNGEFQRILRCVDILHNYNTSLLTCNFSK